MPLKAVSLECPNSHCDANSEGRRIDDFFPVDSLDELQSGTLVDTMCEACGQQLRVAFSGCRISGGISDSAPEQDGHPDGHMHIHFIRCDDPSTEVVISPETGNGWLKTEPGSKTHRELLDSGVQPDVRTWTPIPPAGGKKSKKDLN